MIGGNISATIQTPLSTKNEIGEMVQAWSNAQILNGWLDLSGGNAQYSTYNAKIQESTHIFICDFVELASGITAEHARMVINGNVYDIMLIDNPMELNKQLEFYLKFTGGQ